MRIGFFDSGLGGLTILRETLRVLPDYDYVYYGDTAHVPYGDRSESEVYELTKAGVEHLFAHDCALVILACNTVSAETLRRLQDTYLPGAYAERRILGVVIPTVEALVQSGARRATLIGTTRTIESRKYDIELAARNITRLILTSVATPRLVPLIEAGDIDTAATNAIDVIKREAGEPDTVVLGCTHYTLLKDTIRAQLGPSVRILSQDEIVPRKLADYLMRHAEIESTLARNGERTIYLTDEQPTYRKVCEQILSD